MIGVAGGVVNGHSSFASGHTHRCLPTQTAENTDGRAEAAPVRRRHGTCSCHDIGAGCKESLDQCVFGRGPRWPALLWTSELHRGHPAMSSACCSVQRSRVLRSTVRDRRMICVSACIHAPCVLFLCRVDRKEVSLLCLVHTAHVHVPSMFGIGGPSHRGPFCSEPEFVLRVS